MNIEKLLKEQAFQINTTIVESLLNDDPIIRVDSDLMLYGISLDNTLMDLILNKIQRINIKELDLSIPNYDMYLESRIGEIFRYPERLMNLHVLKLFVPEGENYQTILDTIIDSSPNLRIIGLYGNMTPEWIQNMFSKLATYKNLEEVEISAESAAAPLQFLHSSLYLEKIITGLPPNTTHNTPNTQTYTLGSYISGDAFIRVLHTLKEYNIGHEKFNSHKYIPTPNTLPNSLMHNELWLSPISFIQYSTNKIVVKKLIGNQWEASQSWDYDIVHFVVNFDGKNKIIIGANNQYISYVYHDKTQELIENATYTVPYPHDSKPEQLTMVPMLNGGAMFLNIDFAPPYWGISCNIDKDSVKSYMSTEEGKIGFSSINNLNVPLAIDESHIITKNHDAIQVYNVDSGKYEEILANWHILPFWGKNTICGINLDYPDLDNKLASIYDYIPKSITLTFWKNTKGLKISHSIKLAMHSLFDMEQYKSSPILFNEQKNVLFRGSTDRGPQRIIQSNIEKVGLPKDNVFIPMFKYKTLPIKQQPVWKETDDFQISDGEGNVYRKEKATLNLPVLPYLLEKNFEHAICFSRGEIINLLLNIHAVHTNRYLCDLIAPEIAYYIENSLSSNQTLPHTLCSIVVDGPQTFADFCSNQEVVRIYLEEVIALPKYVLGDINIIRNVKSSIIDIIAKVFLIDIHIEFDPALNIPHKIYKSYRHYNDSPIKIVLGFKHGEYFRINTAPAGQNFISLMDTKRRLWCDRYVIATETELFEIHQVMRHLKEFVDLHPSVTEELIIAEYKNIIKFTAKETPTLAELMNVAIAWYLDLMNYTRYENLKLPGYCEDHVKNIGKKYYPLFKLIYQLKTNISGIDAELSNRYNIVLFTMAKAIEDKMFIQFMGIQENNFVQYEDSLFIISPKVEQLYLDWMTEPRNRPILSTCNIL